METLIYHFLLQAAAATSTVLIAFTVPSLELFALVFPSRDNLCLSFPFKCISYFDKKQILEE